MKAALSCSRWLNKDFPAAAALFPFRMMTGKEDPA